MAVNEVTKPARRVLLSAAVVSAIGVGVAGSASPVGGGVILVLGWIAFVYGLHTFGRSGPEPSASSAAPARPPSGDGPI
jgi:hypothetical protein